MAKTITTIAAAVLCFISCLCTRASAQLQEEEILSLAVFISAINDSGSFTGGAGVGRPFVEAVDLAVELVNNDTELIPGYALQYELADSQVKLKLPVALLTGLISKPYTCGCFQLTQHAMPPWLR